MPPLLLRDLALTLAEKELGKPYVWGGNDPISGFDCSGLMIEVLKATGRLPRMGDWNAAALAAKFPKITRPLEAGDLVFWNRGAPPHIGHVEMVYGVYRDVVLTIGASGGGRSTDSREAAIAQDAYVKVRPITPGYVLAVDPFAP